MHDDVHLTQRQWIELHSKAKAYIAGLSFWQRHGVEWAVFGLRVLGFALSFLIFAQEGIAFKAVGIVLLSFFFYGIAITGTHEASHDSFTPWRKINILLGYFFADVWTGQSSLWWKNRHVVIHHVHSNNPTKEPNSFFFAWMPGWVYFFVIPYLVQIWLYMHSTAFLKKRPGQLVLYNILFWGGIAMHVALFSLVLPVGYAVVATFVMRLLFAPIFVHIAVFNHIGLDVIPMQIPWLPRQVRTTRNMKKHWFLSGIGGNAFVECHVEHHLFPTMSNHMLNKLRPLTKDYLEKRGYVYVEQGYIECLVYCLKHYREVFNHVNSTAAI